MHNSFHELTCVKETGHVTQTVWDVPDWVYKVKDGPVVAWNSPIVINRSPRKHHKLGIPLWHNNAYMWCFLTSLYIDWQKVRLADLHCFSRQSLRTLCSRHNTKSHWSSYSSTRKVIKGYNPNKMWFSIYGTNLNSRKITYVLGSIFFFIQHLNITTKISKLSMWPKWRRI